jgi:hypothetical protein
VITSHFENTEPKNCLKDKIRHMAVWNIVQKLYSTLKMNILMCFTFIFVKTTFRTRIERLNVKLTNSVAQEPEGSSPHSQQPATGPCPEPVESNPHPQANLPKIHSHPIFPPTPWSSKW